MSRFAFRLFVAGRQARSQHMVGHFREICERHIMGHYELTVIDVLSRPDLAHRDRVLATPTVIRLSPGPACRIIGDLADEQALVSELGLQPGQPAGGSEAAGLVENKVRKQTGAPLP